MGTQKELFDQLGVKQSSHMPEGFRYQEDFVTQAEEYSLVESLATVELKPFEFHGHSGNRRVTSFGLRYDFTRRTVHAAEELPSFLGALAVKVSKSRIAEWTNFDNAVSTNIQQEQESVGTRTSPSLE